MVPELMIIEELSIASAGSFNDLFSPPPITVFFYGVKIFPHPLGRLIGPESALIAYIEM